MRRGRLRRIAVSSVAAITASALLSGCWLLGDRGREAAGQRAADELVAEAGLAELVEVEFRCVARHVFGDEYACQVERVELTSDELADLDRVAEILPELAALGDYPDLLPKVTLGYRGTSYWVDGDRRAFVAAFDAVKPPEAERVGLYTSSDGSPLSVGVQVEAATAFSRSCTIALELTVALGAELGPVSVTASGPPQGTVSATATPADEGLAAVCALVEELLGDGDLPGVEAVTLGPRRHPDGEVLGLLLYLDSSEHPQAEIEALRARVQEEVDATGATALVEVIGW